MSEQQKAPQVLVKSRASKDPQLLELVQSTLDPNRHYRWVRARGDESHMSVTKHKLRGYVVETHKKEGVKTRAALENTTEGSPIKLGDLILMSCPKDVHIRRQEEKRQRRESVLASTSAQTKEMAKEKGVQLMKDPDHDKVSETIT